MRESEHHNHRAAPPQRCRHQAEPVVALVTECGKNQQDIPLTVERL